MEGQALPGRHDYHTHLLPGIDDGAESWENALQMAAVLADCGFTHACCTPHQIYGLYAPDVGQVEFAVARLQQQVDDAGIPLTVMPGMEYLLDDNFAQHLDCLLPLGDSDQVLVELPNHTSLEPLLELLFAIVRRGFVPLIAHPERCQRLFVDSRSFHFWFGKKKTECAPLVEQMVQMGCRFQANIGSFCGFYGPQARHQARTMLNGGLYSCFGSDAHNPDDLKGYLRLGMSVLEHQGVEV
ncbi:MAG: phosphoesterase [Desulfuromonas sp.]|nr:MAG: phosphoesterase [Desulfuromonas sp.]